MHKAVQTVSPIRLACEDLAVCQPVSALSVIITATTKKMCVFMHAWWCLWALMCTHQSVFLCVLKPSCRQMETSGTTPGVSLLKHPSHPPIHPSPSCVLSLSLSPPPLLPPFPLAPLRSPSRKKASILRRQAPEPGLRQWKSSVTTKSQI